jgi:hypothetical protein
MWKLIVGDGETQHGPDFTWLDLQARHGGMDKLAGAGVHVPEPLSRKIAELKATIPHNKVAFYNRALGSFESFGLNRNGDGFARDELRRKHATFVSNAHYFQYHQNKDPALSRGRPVASAFNDQTDMVDLIIVADMDKCAEQIQALESGRRVPTSMGAKVAFDQCTICDHRAKKREDYCQHVHKLAEAPYGMRAVLSNGQVCGVMNPDPNFFDISDVVIGAAPESETLLKVASFSGQLSGAELAEIVGLPKVARDVEAAITKRVPGVIEGNPVTRRGVREMSEREDELPPHLIDAVRRESGFDGVLRNSAAAGIVLKPREFARAAKLGAFSPPTQEEVWASEPMPKKVLASALSPRAMAMFADHYDQRSAHMPALVNRIDELRTKTASRYEVDGQEDERARVMYASYRKSLMSEMPDVGGHEGEYWGVKYASTSSVMFGDFSRDYVACAHLAASDDVVHKVLDRVVKMAQPSLTAPAPQITGTLADELGVEALDLIAVKSLNRI